MVFTGDSWKVTKSAIVIAHRKKEGTLYLTKKINGSMTVVETSVNIDT